MNAKVALSENKANQKLMEMINRLMAMPKGPAPHESKKASAQASAKKRADSTKK